MREGAKGAAREVEVDAFLPKLAERDEECEMEQTAKFGEVDGLGTLLISISRSIRQAFSAHLPRQGPARSTCRP